MVAGNILDFKSNLHTLHCMALGPAVHVSQGRVCWQPCGEALAATLLEIAADLESVFLLPSVEPGTLHLLARLELDACR